MYRETLLINIDYLRPQTQDKQETYLVHITKATQSMYLSIVEKQAQMMMLNIFKVFPTPTVTVVRNKNKLFQKPGNKRF